MDDLHDQHPPFLDSLLYLEFWLGGLFFFDEFVCSLKSFLLTLKHRLVCRWVAGLSREARVLFLL